MTHPKSYWCRIVGAVGTLAVIAFLISYQPKVEDFKAVIQRGGALFTNTMTNATSPRIPDTSRRHTNLSPAQAEIDSMRTKAVAQRLSLWTRSARARSPKGNIQKAAKRTIRPVDGSDVLYVVTTDSNFYETRVRNLLETWGSDVPPERLLIVGDRSGHVKGTTIESSNCAARSHGNGACCKNADAVYSAFARMQKNASLAWAYFSDDDAYVVVKNMPTALNSIAISMRSFGGTRPLGINVGIHACQTTSCRGLCGGGGYALDRQALERLVSHRSRQQFIAEQMKACDKCQQWGDQALSLLIQQRGIKEVEAHGLNGFVLNAKTFATSLLSTPPLSYHYIRMEGQMKFLHGLFALAGKHPTCAQSGHFCAQYTHKDGDVRRCCTSSSKIEDRPWSRRLSGAEEGADRLDIASLKHHLGLRGPWPRQAMEDRLLAAGSDLPPSLKEGA